MQDFVQGDRNQPYLLPPDLREWLPEDDLAHFVVADIDSVPTGLGTPTQVLAASASCRDEQD